MNGKQYFKTCCAELEIDCDTYFKMGEQDPKNDSFFKFKNDYHTRKESQIFAINYFKSQNIYLAWSLKRPKANTLNTFTLSKQSVNIIHPSQVLPINKATEHSGWGEEIVYAFQPEAVKEFLKKYCMKSIK